MWPHPLCRLSKIDGLNLVVVLQIIRLGLSACKCTIVWHVFLCFNTITITFRTKWSFSKSWFVEIWKLFELWSTANNWKLMNHHNQNSEIIQRTWKWQSRIKKNWHVRAIQPCPPDGGRWVEGQGWPKHEISPVHVWQDNRLQMTGLISKLTASYYGYTLHKPTYIKQQCHIKASIII